MRPKLALLLQAAGIGLLLTGCSTTTENPQHVQSADANPQKLEIDGLALSASPMTKKAQVKQVFHVNLLAEGVIPIRIIAENNSPSSSFIVAKDKVVVMVETSGETNSTQHGEGAKDLSRVSREQQIRGKELAPLALLGTPPILVLMVLMTPIDSELIDRGREYNLATKEFYTRTVRSGQRAEGFIFYRTPKADSHSKAYHVVAHVKNSSKEELTAFDLKVNLNLEPP